ncbi:hypothetical protein B0H13DRAFT_1898643 [Mycena leptocephala]|nr:hypothetical protein B0H13DRAFT_1898643 [Mycena leptocephala]
MEQHFLGTHVTAGHPDTAMELQIQLHTIMNQGSITRESRSSIGGANKLEAFRAAQQQRLGYDSDIAATIQDLPHSPPIHHALPMSLDNQFMNRSSLSSYAVHRLYHEQLLDARPDTKAPPLKRQRVHRPKVLRREAVAYTQIKEEGMPNLLSPVIEGFKYYRHVSPYHPQKNPHVAPPLLTLATAEDSRHITKRVEVVIDVLSRNGHYFTVTLGFDQQVRMGTRLRFEGKLIGNWEAEELQWTSDGYAFVRMKELIRMERATVAIPEQLVQMVGPHEVSTDL